jgi:hypothetical protein
MRVKGKVGLLRNTPPRQIVRAALTVALVAAVPALALALWGGGLAKARWDEPAAAEAFPFDAPATTLAQARSQEGAGPVSPTADGVPAPGDDSVLVLDRWEQAAKPGPPPKAPPRPLVASPSASTKRKPSPFQ